MPSAARTSIVNAIERYGSTVTLNYKPAANLPVAGDWPNPNSPTLGAPDPKNIKAIVAPQQDKEGVIYNEGEEPRELVQAVFKPDENLNEVATVIWQGNTYTIQHGDNYELSDEKLAQVVIMARTKAVVEMPYG